MPRFIKDRKKNRGLAPGSLVFIGNQKMDATRITAIQWSGEQLNEFEVTNPGQLIEMINENAMTWINVYGLHDEPLLQSIGEKLNISPLLLEDIMNTDQRPRFYETEEGHGFIMKTLEWYPPEERIIADQISFVVGSNYLICFQEKKANIFDPVRERLRVGKGRIRTGGYDYVLYALIDTLIDNYLDIAGQIGEIAEALSKEVIADPRKDLANRIYKYRIEISIIRKCIRPVKEMILQWLKSDSVMLQKKTRAFISDLADLVTQSEESVEVYNNLLADALNIHNTNISNRANEIMKVLTIFAAIFIPLTFFAGIYGMNFDYIPELKFRYGYYIFWGFVVVLGSGMFFFFRRKKWF